MSNANILVSFNPLIPGNIGFNPATLDVKVTDKSILFTFQNSPSMKFNAFKSIDPLHQLLKADVTDTQITITDIDTMRDDIQYTVSIMDVEGQVFTSDPQIINIPKHQDF